MAIIDITHAMLMLYFDTLLARFDAFAVIYYAMLMLITPLRHCRRHYHAVSSPPLLSPCYADDLLLLIILRAFYLRALCYMITAIYDAMLIAL